MILDLALSFEFGKACKAILRDKPEQRDFILKHERRCLVTEALQGQLKAYEHRFGRRVNKKDRKALVLETAKMFVASALKSFDDYQMSEAKRIAIENKVNREKEAMEIAADCVEERVTVRGAQD